MAGAGLGPRSGGPGLAAGDPIHSSWSLQAWLILLVLAATAPLVAYGLFHAVSSYLAQRSVLIESTAEVARTLAQTTAEELDHELLALRAFARTPTLQTADFADFAPHAPELLASSPPGSTLAVYDIGGRTLFTTGSKRPLRRDPRTSARVFATGEPIVSDLETEPGQAPAICIDAPVSRDGRVVSDLALYLPLAPLQAIVARQRLPRGWIDSILDGTGRIVAHMPDPAALLGRPAHPGLLRLLASGATEGTVETPLYNGTVSVVAVARVPHFAWSAVVGIPRKQIFAPLRATLGEMMVVGVAALALSLGLASFIARRLARPVTSLARLAVAMEGDDEVPAHEPGLREADAVARVLQDMVRRRRAAEATADDAELRAARLIESVPCGVIVFARDGHWLFVNRTTCDLLARSSQELLGLTVHSPDLEVQTVEGAPIPPDKRASAQALLGEPVRDMEVTMRRGTGERIALLLSSAPLRDRDGEIIGALTAMLDVTERRAAQDRLDNLLATLEARVRDEVAAREAAQLEAAQAQKMQALGELAGGVAHDFNNVLQAVSGAVALIEQRAGNPGEVRRFAHTAAEAAERGAAVAGRLLTFARRGELRAVPIEAAALLRETAEMLRHTLGTQVEVRTEVASDVGWLMADLPQLQTVLLNLAANARDAMPEGGTLTLRAVGEVVDANGPGPAGLRPGHYVRLEAGDTGMGMDAATLARATEPFFTTKPPHKGTGLGLAMARGFAEQLGGGLAIHSTTGHGTTVLLWLPVADQPPLVKGTQAPPPGAGPRFLRILLVDDEDAGRTLMAETLADHGFAVDQAHDAAAARALLAARAYDVLVTDFSMPGENGVALIAAARVLRPGLPAVLLTGLGADPALLDAIAGVGVGPTETVGKPILSADLAIRIIRLAGAAT